MDIDAAITDLFDHTKPQDQRHRAMEVLETAKLQPELLDSALQKLSTLTLDSPSGLNLIFWYLQYLEETINLRYSLLPPSSVANLHQFLTYIMENRSDLFAQHMLLHKFALLYVRVIKHEFPSIWPEAFDVLMQKTSNDLQVKLFLTVMKTFHEEFAENLGSATQEELKKSSLIKDALKERTLVPASNIWRSILASQNKELISATLKVLSSYVEWCPIDLTMTFVADIFKFINEPDLQVFSLQCIERIIAKKMESSAKLEIIHKLDIIRLVQAFNISNFNLALSDVPATIANLVDTLGCHVLECKAEQYLQILLEKALQCFDTDEPQVSKTVFNFLSGYIHALKEKANAGILISDVERNNINNICMTIMKRSMFPSSFEHIGAELSDEEDQFQKYRKELASLFKQLLQVENVKEPVLDYLIGIFRTMLPNLASYSKENIEVALFLLFQFGECLTDISKLLTTENKYSDLLKQIFTSELKASKEKIVIREYLETAIRYAAFFDCNLHAPLLGNVLQSVILNISSPDPEISKHAVYMFYRSTLKISNQMVKYSADILNAIGPKLAGDLDASSEEYLYKGLGLIVCNKAYVGQEQMLEQLAGFILKEFSPKSIKNLCEVIGGFKRRAEPPVNLTVKKIVIGTLQSVPGQITADWFEALIHLCQKAIEALEEDSSAVVKPMLEFLLPKSFEFGAEIYMGLLTSVMSKYKSAIAETIPQTLVHQFIVNVMVQCPKPTETISEVAQQMIQARRSFFRVLEGFLKSDIDFFNPEYFENLIVYIQEACLNFIETATLKYAMLDMWKISEKAMVNTQIAAVLMEKLFVLTVNVIKNFGFNVKSPEANGLAGELINSHKVILEFAMRNNNQQELLNQILVNLPAPSTNQYASCLVENIALLCQPNLDKAQWNKMIAQLKSYILSIASELSNR